MNIRVVVAAMALAVASIAVTAIVSASAVSNDIVQAVADPSRPKDDRDADALRAPAETLAFSGVKPGMTVFELYPCGDRKSTRLNSSHIPLSRMPSSAC